MRIQFLQHVFLLPRGFSFFVIAPQNLAVGYCGPPSFLEYSVQNLDRVLHILQGFLQIHGLWRQNFFGYP